MLADKREQVNAIDEQIVALFEQRMAISKEIADIKLQQERDVFDKNRHQRVLEHVTSCLKDKSLTDDVTALYEEIMRLSRKNQIDWIKQNANN